MSAATKTLHSPAELTLIGCDDRTEIVVFQSASAHDTRRINTTALDTSTGAILCDCKAAEFGRVCWHADHIAAAWWQTPAMRACRFLATYRQRCGRPLQDDVTALVAARSEWRRRQATAPADLAVAHMPLAA